MSTSPAARTPVSSQAKDKPKAEKAQPEPSKPNPFAFFKGAAP
ncbi:hypothetical protein [Parvularcula maris]|uniref:Uncharacterized protein n=1 Tax=Parvularcula maris TaxID=2965077 RepID=A0A9X2L7Q1_9PROT|nr:hypothetical protein [Parvularcula maris]MCQ8184479.1 hypothetical protein [Parvularcula maris]